MAWIECIRQVDRLDDDLESGTSSGEKRFLCRSDTAITNTDEFFNADDGTDRVPPSTEAYSANRPRAAQKNRRVERRNSFQAEVIITFKDPTLGQFATDTDLLNAPAKFSEADQEFMEEYVVDHKDPPEAVVNAAGEPFDHGPERLAGVTIITMKKFVNAATRIAIRNAKRTTNQNILTIDGQSYEVDTVLLANAAFEPVSGSTSVWEATVVFKAKKEGWSDQALNVGYSELVAGERQDINQKDAAGKDVPVTKPWPLEFNGSKKPNADDPIDTLTFVPYALSTWSGVPLT